MRTIIYQDKAIACPRNIALSPYGYEPPTRLTLRWLWLVNLLLKLLTLLLALLFCTSQPVEFPFLAAQVLSGVVHNIDGG